MAKKIKVLIADDHRVVREGLSAILETKEEIHIVGEAGDGGEAVEKARQLLPDVIVMDVSMPGMTGVEATRIIKREMPHIGIIALTMYEDHQYIFDLVRAGATGYLLKDSDSTEIVAAIRAISRGESLIHPSVASKNSSRIFVIGRRQRQKKVLTGTRPHGARDHRPAIGGGRQDQQGNRQRVGPEREDREKSRPQHLPQTPRV